MSWGDHVAQRDLDALSDELATIRHAERRIAENVAYLRGEGVPWSIIGEQLGMTKQAAQQRFAPRAATPRVDAQQLQIEV